MINHPVYILIISRNAGEIEMIKSIIRDFAPHSVCVIAATDGKLQEQLDWANYHLVICDHNLPDAQALRANMRIRIQRPQLPFVLINDSLELPADAIRLFNDNGWKIKASLDRSQLAYSGAVLYSVYRNNETEIELERQQVEVNNRKKLLLQRFESLINRFSGQLSMARLECFSRWMFSQNETAESAFS